MRINRLACFLHGFRRVLVTSPFAPRAASTPAILARPLVSDLIYQRMLREVRRPGGRARFDAYETLLSRARTKEVGIVRSEGRLVELGQWASLAVVLGLMFMAGTASWLGAPDPIAVLPAIAVAGLYLWAALAAPSPATI